MWGLLFFEVYGLGLIFRVVEFLEFVKIKSRSQVFSCMAIACDDSSLMKILSRPLCHGRFTLGTAPTQKQLDNDYNMVMLYVAFNRTPNIDCDWVGAVP